MNKIRFFTVGLISICLLAAMAILAFADSASADTTRYVKEGGTGDGTSWATASGELQDMIDAVEAAGGGTVYVASATYTPTTIFQTGAPRSAAFQMKNGVAIYGGFPNTGSPSWGDRNWETHSTVLSGEIGTPETITDNCYHVFYHPSMINLDGTAILDGFTITGGNADGSWPNDQGGGMYNYSSSPQVNNCTFSGNSAKFGGGMYNDYYSSPIVTNCTFSGNSADYYGGGMYNYYYSSPIVTNCNFSGNSVDYYGGGIYNNSSSPQVTNCNFSGNSAYFGGGMYNDYYSSPIVTNCNFSGNSADYYGGGMYNYYYSSPIVTNCNFSGNSADYDGGGMYNIEYSSPTLTNCTFSGNSAVYDGGGMSNKYSSSPQVTNCILWGDIASSGNELYNNSSSPVVTYSDIQGGYAGAGNIDANPLWANPASGDFHLQASSPCINAGSNAAIQSTGVTEDFEGDDRIIDGTVDMGVDETPWSPWTCLAYDSNSSGQIEYAEMVTALMDYLTSGISYSQMIDVLMCYLTA